ncbi:MAG: translation initiation factor IF-2 [bacterium]
MSGTRRVFQVARELHISNEAAISFLGKLDSKIHNQMSSVPDSLYEKICQKYNSDNIATDVEQDFRQRLKDKKILDELRRSKARKELEERIKVATRIAEERPRRRKEAQETAEQKAEEQRKLAEQEKKLKEVQAEKVAEKPEELSVVERISRAKKEIERQNKLAKAQKTGEEKEVGAQEGKKKGVVAKEKTALEEGAGQEKVAAEVKVKAETPAKTKKARKGKTEEQEVVATEAKDEKEKEKKEEKESKKKLAGTEKQTQEKGKRKKKRKKRKISEEEIEESIRQTLAAMEEVKPKRRKRKVKGTEETEEVDENVIKVSEFISTAELADMLNVEPTEVIQKCLQLGMMVSINQRLDMETIVSVADEFGCEVEIVQEYGADTIDHEDLLEIDEETAVPRHPVVTIMGHVDHGKTSLLDYIRKSNIIAGEAGSITQHIGAYEVQVDGSAITFLDTPGHEAFTAMRARGAQVTDLVVLIVAADDGVQPQTIEAINHAKAAGVPIVVAINKIDKPAANPEQLKKQLADNDVLVESWGGKYQSVEISAKKGIGIDKLLEMILLEADILELKANPEHKARGIIIEARLDKGKGPVATVLVQNGTLRVGDSFVSGQFSGKVRAMYNERNKKVTKAPPATPVQVVGFDGVPQAGDTFVVMDTEREVREISMKRQQLRREQDFRRARHVTLDQISQRIREGVVKELNLIVKADVDGSAEALSDALMKLSNDEVSVNVIHKGVGGISESDILLAAASHAVIVGFHIRPTLQARELAEKENVDIHLYRVIYDAVEDVKLALEGMLEPEIVEEMTASVEVRDIFKVPKTGTVAGCYVQSGKINRNDLAKIYRDDKLLYETKIKSLKRFKDDVREVAAGFECGVGLEGFDDVKIGDIIESYQQIETKRKLQI